MPSAFRTPGVITALLALAFSPASRAQAIAEPAAAPVVEPAKLLPAPPKHEHVISDEMATTVASGLPKYQPPKPDGEAPDLRDTDKPKNGIIRLPKYIVQKPKEPKPPVFTERQILTQKGLIDLALKRQPGLKFGNFFGMNEGLALLMFEEQERLDNLADMADLVKSARDAGDETGAESLAHERMRLAYRPSGIGGAAAPGH